MARRNTARSWSTYHPEALNVTMRPAKAHLRDTAHDTGGPAVQESARQESRIADAFESPESKTIARACYDDTTQVLSVHFKRAKGEDRYDYSGIPAELWAEFVMAESKGQFFSARIRPLYEGTRITRK